MTEKFRKVNIPLFLCDITDEIRERLPAGDKSDRNKDVIRLRRILDVMCGDYVRFVNGNMENKYRVDWQGFMATGFRGLNRKVMLGTLTDKNKYEYQIYDLESFFEKLEQLYEREIGAADNRCDVFIKTGQMVELAL